MDGTDIRFERVSFETFGILPLSERGLCEVGVKGSVAGEAFCDPSSSKKEEIAAELPGSDVDVGLYGFVCYFGKNAGGGVLTITKFGQFPPA